MISTIYTITNKAGRSFAINDTADPENFLGLQEYPQFDVDIKNNEITKEGQHGIWDFYSFYGRRSITFQGVIIGDSELSIEAQKEVMLTTLGFPSQPNATADGSVLLTWTDIAGNDWQIECKLQSNVRYTRTKQDYTLLEFFFTLKSSDPFIVGQTLMSADGVRGWRETGTTFPMTLPDLLGETVNGALVVPNTGSIDANTLIRIYGEAQGAITAPRITNVSTGQAFFLSSTLADETEWIEIDSKEGTVVDQNGSDLSADIIGASEFILLASGNNDILYESDQNPAQTLLDPTALFNVKYRDTKI